MKLTIKQTLLTVVVASILAFAGYTIFLNQLSVVNLYWGVIKKMSSPSIKSPEIQKAHDILDQDDLPSAKETYQRMNSNGDIFNLGVGIGLTQTTYNTANALTKPSKMRKLLHKEARQKTSAHHFLKKQMWYALGSLQEIHCNLCDKTINMQNLQDLSTTIQKNLIDNISDNLKKLNNDEITVTRCPYCQSKDITLKEQDYKKFDTKCQKKLLQQVEHIGSFKQSGDLPTCRISLQLADLLEENSDQIDEDKLQKTAQFIAQFKSPLIFIHHYSNPEVKPHLFEKEEDIAWFAHICKRVAESCKNVSFICPISQPLSFGFKVTYVHSLPPFSCTIPSQQYFNNILRAQQEATRAIKSVRPDIKVLLSHQWKPAKPVHTSLFDPRNFLEKIIAAISDTLYNQSFIQLFKEYAQEADGIALSIYPSLHFNYFTAIDSNCSKVVDPHGALESIIDIHEGFPDKDIYVVETGCNCSNMEIKKEFLESTLHVLHVAKNLNIPIKTCFVWTNTNDINFYREWNKAPGTTNFGIYDTMDIDSVTDFGKYIQTIISEK